MGLTIQDSRKNVEKLFFRLGNKQDHKYWDVYSIEVRLVKLAEQSGMAWVIPNSDSNKVYQEHFSTEEYDRWMDRRELPANYRLIQGALFFLDNDTQIDSEEEFYPRFLWCSPNLGQVLGQSKLVSSGSEIVLSPLSTPFVYHTPGV